MTIHIIQLIVTGIKVTNKGAMDKETNGVQEKAI